jgi:putative peptidoglycan lipid II flippase
MVRSFLKFIQKEITGVHEAAYLLALFAFLSQVLALVRDHLLAHFFGASHLLDIYYASFRIPDVIFATVGSMVSIAVLVPFFTEKMQKDEPQKAQRFIDDTFSIFLMAIGAVALIAFIIDPWLIPRVLPGFAHDPALPQLILTTRIMLLSPLFLGISNFLSSITQIYNRFLIYATSPLLYNLGIIFGAVVLAPHFGVIGLALGVAIGAFFHCFIQVPFILYKGIFPRFRPWINWHSIRRVVLLSFPRTLTISSNQIATFFLIAFASLMTAGSISVFNYSFNLQSVVVSIVGVSYSSAAFPLLARLFTEKKMGDYVEQMVTSSRHIAFWSTPFMVLFIVLRAQIVRVILGSGQFDWSDTRLTAACLAVFAISLIPQSLILLFVRALYAEGHTKKPMIINLFSSTCIVLLGYGLMIFYGAWPAFSRFLDALLKVQDIPGTIVLMLPLAYTLGVFINTILHWVAFHREFPAYSKPVIRSFFQIFAASIIMGYVTYLGLEFFSSVLPLTTVIGIFLQGVGAAIVGVAAGIWILRLLDNVELKEIWAALKKTIRQKLGGTRILMPEQEQL